MSRRYVLGVQFAALLAALLLPQPLWAVDGAFGDPTRPSSLHDSSSVKVREAGPRWRLQSIRVASDRRTAVINERSVGVGETVDGATVTAIRSDGVSLQAGGQRVELPLVPQAAQIRKSAN